MSRLLPLLLIGCAGAGADSGTGDGTGDGAGSVAAGLECSLSPAISGDVHTLRTSPDGTVYALNSAGAIYRYTRTGDKTCELSGAAIWDEASTLKAATDFDLDAEGTIYLLSFYSTLIRMTPDGTITATCEVTAGHGLAVTPDGTMAWSIPIGDSELHPIAFDATGCAETGELWTYDFGLGTAPTASADLLAFDAHDSTGTLPPGWRMDPKTGEVLGDLGVGTDPETEAELAAIDDIAITPDGFWVAGSPDGGLWRLGADGAVVRRTEAVDFLPTGDDTTMISIRSIGWTPSGPSYVGGGFVGTEGIWSVEL